MKMVSNFNISPEYEQVRRKYCFYLDIQNQGLARAISRKIEGMRLRQDVFLTPRVTHVVRERPRKERTEALQWPRRDCKRTDAMLERVRSIQPHPLPPTDHHAYTELTVQKAICLLTNLYTKYFSTSKDTVRVFSKHFIKIEFLDKVCRPVFKEFDTWPSISLEPNQPKKVKKSTSEIKDHNSIFHNSKKNNTVGQKMTRKSRPRIKEKEEKEPKGGYCEMCNIDYIDATVHRKSAHHLAYIKDHNNFLSLDTLISAGADVSTFLDKASQPINGERRSLRKLCNGDVDSKSKRSGRSQSPDSTVNGAESPRRNGGLDDERKHNTRCSKRTSDSLSEDRQYYKVVDVSTKLRSSRGFTRKKDSSPIVNGTNKPLVVKFRKVRKSELSVLSDEAEQFMFPKRASSTSSTSSEDEEKEVLTKLKSPIQPPPTLERRRLARPLALKEESSEEDSWPEDKKKKKRRVPTVTRRTRRTPIKALTPEKKLPEVIYPEPTAPIQQEKETEIISPLQEESVERCIKWEGGKLKYTPAVEQLEFAFECVPQSEPWFEAFKRQDEDKVVIKNVPLYFELYTKSPKLPYETGQLPPLKPNCCPLNDLVKREEKPGPSRSYGTRGMKKQKIRKRTAAVMAMDSHPRKSPREHASTLAILGSAGLLRRRNADDAKSTASEDTVSDINSNTKVELMVSETQETSERLQQFLSEVFDDASEYDISEELLDGDPAVVTSTAPDVLSLVSECEDCNIIENEIKDSAATRTRNVRGRIKKKNRTGWPSKRRQVKKSSRTNSAESTLKADSSLDRSSIAMSEMPDEDTRDMISEDETIASESEVDTEKTLTPQREEQDIEKDKSDLRLDVKVLVQDKDKEKVQVENKDVEDESEKEEKCKRRKRSSIQSVGNWLQPVVRVARVDPGAARRLRSASRVRSNRYR